MTTHRTVEELMTPDPISLPGTASVLDAYARYIGTGSMFTDADVRNSAHVAVIGQTTADSLFPDGNALDNTVVIQKAPFRVIGILSVVGATGGFNPDDSISAATEEMRPPAGVFLVASLHDEPVGCGALKFHGTDAAELKRMWVSPRVRGLGVGRRLLERLEQLTREHGATAIRLETNKALTEAIDLYRSNGYDEVPPFNEEPYADHWFEKSVA